MNKWHYSSFVSIRLSARCVPSRPRTTPSAPTPEGTDIQTPHPFSGALFHYCTRHAHLHIKSCSNISHSNIVEMNESVRNVAILRYVSRTSRCQRHVNELLQDPGLFPDEGNGRMGTKFVITALKFSLVDLHPVACVHRASGSIVSTDVCTRKFCCCRASA
jgi:hypothetical protein